MSSAAMNSTQETAKTFVIQVFSGQQSALFWSKSHFGAQGILFSSRPSTMKPCTVSLRRSERRVHYSTFHRYPQITYCVPDKNVVIFHVVPIQNTGVRNQTSWRLWRSMSSCTGRRWSAKVIRMVPHGPTGTDERTVMNDGKMMEKMDRMELPVEWRTLHDTSWYW